MARYHLHPVVKYIYDQLKPATRHDKDLHIDLANLQSTLLELQREFGPPRIVEEAMVVTGGSSSRWVWEKFTVYEYHSIAILQA